MKTKTQDFDLIADHGVPHIFLQLKNTDICMDFHCDCGAFCHFDGYFAHHVLCPHCKQEWVLPPILFPRKRTASDYPHDPKILEADEDYVDDDGVALPVPAE